MDKLGIKADLDSDTEVTSKSAFWKTYTGTGTINLDAKLKKDGNFESELGIEFAL